MNRQFFFSVLVLFILLLVNGSSYSLSSPPQPQKSFQNLSETIQALDKTRTITLTKLASSESHIVKKISHQQREDYSDFIEYLSFKINEYCYQILKKYGDEKKENLPCSDNISLRTKIDETVYETNEEKIESLDEEFMNSLGNFDEMLLDEHGKIAQINKKNSNVKEASSSSDKYQSESES